MVASLSYFDMMWCFFFSLPGRSEVNVGLRKKPLTRLCYIWTHTPYANTPKKTFILEPSHLQTLKTVLSVTEPVRIPLFKGTSAERMLTLKVRLEPCHAYP